MVINAQMLAAGEALFARRWQFLKSAPTLEALPEADRPEVAFAGRSNVGKSSLINAIVNQRGLARTSNTPGRTQELNFFITDSAHFYLVDMPGYGFAKAPKEKVQAWTELIGAYMRGRPTLARVFLLIDSRHGLKLPDHDVMQLLDEAGVTYQAVLTKTDKIKGRELEAVAIRTHEVLRGHAAAYPELIVTSSETGAGIAELRAVIAQVVKARSSR